MTQLKPIEEYAKVRSLIAQLEEQKRDLEPLVFDEIKKTGEKSYDTDLGKVTISEGVKYTYSDDFVNQEKALKAEAKQITDKIKMLQLDEQEQGIAKAEPTQTVSFKSNLKKND